MRELLPSLHTPFFVCIEEINLCIKITNISTSINILKFVSSGVLKDISVVALQT